MHYFFLNLGHSVFILTLLWGDMLIIFHTVGLKYLFMFCMKTNDFPRWVSPIDLTVAQCRAANAPSTSLTSIVDPVSSSNFAGLGKIRKNISLGFWWVTYVTKTESKWSSYNVGCKSSSCEQAVLNWLHWALSFHLLKAARSLCRYPFPTVFSTCSKKDLAASLEKGVGMCLYNMPEVKVLYGGQKCGNGYVEEGEECDCGEPEVRSRPKLYISALTVHPGAPCVRNQTLF